MGGKQSKSDKHLLHYHRPDENKLWLYMPNNEKFRCFPVYYQGSPFFFGGLESISVPPLGAIFVIGGLWADHSLPQSMMLPPGVEGGLAAP